MATNIRVDIWDQESVQDFLQLDHRNFHGEIVAVEIVAILGEERQRREERKRGERSFAVFKYCSNKHLTVTIFLCSGWLESRRTEWARCSSP